MDAPANPSAEIVGSLLAAGRLRLAAGGFRALTFRPLAQDCGTTLATLTYHFGTKARLVEQLVLAERQIDRAAHAAFADRYAALPRLTPAALGAMLEAYLDEAAGAWAVTTGIWIELLLRAGGDGEAAAAVRPWIEARRAFWRGIFAGRSTEPEAWAEAVLGYVTDEAVHSLVQGRQADYRLLRRMTIERLSGRFPAERQGLSQPALFEATVARLDPALSLPEPGEPGGLPADRRGLIARAAAAVIIQDGADAVTHRSVGRRADAAASTVAYHYQTRLDLLRAGLAAIYLIAQDRLAPEPGVAARLAVAAGTASVALGAGRDRELLPFAVDLRRLRGVNFHRRLAEGGGDRRRFDLCGAQAASVATLGATLLNQAAGEADRAEPLFAWLLADPSAN